MTEQYQNTSNVEAFLSRAYLRILRITIVLSITATIVLTVLLGWRSGFGFAIGAPIAYINLVWLHHGSIMMVERMLGSSSATSSKGRTVMAFVLRYGLMIIAASVILKSFPGMRLGFMLGLFVPIVAAICEGIYEVFVSGKTRS